MYTDDDGELRTALWDHLLGLVFVRNQGNDYERTKLLELAAHWKALGVSVPTFEMDAEPIDAPSPSYWRFGTKVDLRRPPYSLREMVPGAQEPQTRD